MKTIYSVLFSVFLLLTGHILFAQLPQLIGATKSGGGNGYGTIYRSNLDGSAFTPVHSFSDATGNETMGKLILATNKLLYGVNHFGGTHEQGCIFSFDPVNNLYTDLVDFNNTNVVGGLLLASNGLMYGMTDAKDIGGYIFSFDPSSNDSRIVYNFNPNDASEANRCTMIQGSDGKLYGTLNNRGAYDHGMLFSFNIIDRTLTDLYDFATHRPNGGLVKSSNGLIYGTCGDSTGNVIVYNFNPVAKVLTHLHTSDNDYNYEAGFNNYQNDFPTLALNPFSQSAWGVTTKSQKAFSISTKDNSYHQVFTFPADGSNGTQPAYGLLYRDPNIFYGVTYAGGAYGGGVLYIYSPTLGGYKKLHEFTGLLDGAEPANTPVIIPCAAKPAKPGTITGNSQPTCNAIKYYSIKRISGATSYLWTVPAGASISGASADTSIKVIWGKQGGNITILASNYCGNSAIQTKAITITCSQKELSAVNNKAISSANVFPNPTTGDVVIHFYSNNAAKFLIQITDVTGRVFFTKETNATTGENNAHLNIGNLAKGTYYIELTGNSTQIFKVSLQ